MKKNIINFKRKTRTKPMPSRNALGHKERKKIFEVLNYYKKKKIDPGYQGFFEDIYCKNFSKTMGGGYTDAVATGTAALYISLAALQLPKKSEVLVSPVTDPGTISAIILNGLKPKLLDSSKGSYDIHISEIKKRTNKKTSCILVVHSLGRATYMKDIVKFAKKRSIKVLEDCSQAHGAKISGKRVGTFGDIAAFSTMYRKTTISGASGGIVYTKKKNLFQKALAYADRGKPRWLKNFNDRNPNQYLFPALNLHTDEISCAIGIASLKRLDKVRLSRFNYVKKVSELLKHKSKCCIPYGCSKNDSPFTYPIIVNTKKIKISKEKFAEKVLSEGIGLNTHYQYLVRDWAWVKKYLSDSYDTPNAREIRNKSFNLYLNENYGNQEVIDTVNAILKVEKKFCKV